ncbi:unnamed protein product [Candidula unifasciata]|uniref:Sodium-dependent glucose transporter 1 n=1 Tax=Candidula unifasciata TaxID=100452 RepID=A0A8S4A4J5_9EUPU|nr:unnamed protein product [Candidula unifasciata]
MANEVNAEFNSNQEETKVVPEASVDRHNMENLSLRQRLKNHGYRSKVMHTMYLGLTFIALGMVVGQNGPTFLDLQIITNTDLEQASAFFTGASIGYLTGSITAGTIYSRLNKNGLMFSGTLGMGIVAILTAYCKPYGLMIFIKFAGGVTAGFVDTCGNSEQMRIWGNEGQGLMQFLHFAFAFGGVISPLYSAPFLAQKATEHENSTIQSGNSSIAELVIGNFSILNDSSIVTTLGSDVVTNGTGDLTIVGNQETNVHIAFIITGIFSVLSGLPFLIFCLSDKISKKAAKSATEAKITQRKLPKPMFVFILFTLCLFYILYCCVEDTFASFLMTFLVREYTDVTKVEGAHITAIYWASFATSRFLMIFVAKFLSAVRLLYLCCTLMVIAFSSFIISAVAGNILALTVFAALAGLSMSAVFPAGFLFTETELLRVTAPISSCILVSASVGTMVNPLVLGYLMEEFSNMWFCYLLVGETLIVGAIFLFLLNFNRHFVNKRYGRLGSAVIASTINVEEKETRQPLSATQDEVIVGNGSA